VISASHGLISIRLVVARLVPFGCESVCFNVLLYCVFRRNTRRSRGNNRQRKGQVVNSDSERKQKQLNFFLLFSTIFLSDLTPILQSIAAFVAGSGLTGIIVTVYQIREQSKEAARERLRLSVLTADFFECIQNFATVNDLMGCWLVLGDHRQPRLTVNGRLVKASSRQELVPELNNEMLRLMASIDKAKKSGCLFLMPKPIHAAYQKLCDESISALNKILAEREIDSQTVENLEINCTKLEETLQEALGLSKLNK